MLTLFERPHILTPAWYVVGVPTGPVSLPSGPTNTTSPPPGSGELSAALTIVRDGLTPEPLTGAEAILWGTAWEQAGLRVLAGDLPDPYGTALQRLYQRGYIIMWPDLLQPLAEWTIGLAAVPRPSAPSDLPATARTLLDALAADPWLRHHLPSSTDPAAVHAFRAALTPLLGRALALLRPAISAGGVA